MGKYKKIVVASDSFKGSLSSKEVNETVRDVLKNRFPDAEITCFSMSDGGEGLLACFREIQGWQEEEIDVCNPIMKPIKAKYLYNNNVAIVEMAEAAGLTLLKDNERNPLKTTTYGVGELITHAIKYHRCNEIILGIGGSATNDAGFGAIQALGAKFYTVDGGLIKNGICGEDLNSVARIDIIDLKYIVDNVKFTVACDVDNPLYGENGAAYIYAPQKGATMQDVIILDDNLRHVAKFWTKEISEVKGAGAAGGMGAGVSALLGATLKSGILIVFDILKFETAIADADLIITGEGKIDNQTLMGKLICGILQKTQKLNKNILAIAGLVDINENMLPQNLTVMQVTPRGLQLSEAIKKEVAKENIRKTILDFLCQNSP